MDQLWEFVKGLGALVGLASGVWLLWEKGVREQPLAVVVPRRFAERGALHAMFKVKNRSLRPILISWKKTFEPGQLRIARDNSTHGIVAAILDKGTTIALDGEEIREFPVFKPKDFEKIDPDNFMELEFFWSFAQPVIWQRDRRVVLRIRKRSFLALLDEIPQENDDR